MKSLLVGILVSIICLLSFQDLAQVALFKINQDFIIANFCVNKADKIYTCKGKCHLSKVIAQTKDNTSSDTPAPMPETERFSLIYVLDSQETHTLELSFISDNSVFREKELLSSSHLRDLLRPPIS